MCNCISELDKLLEPHGVTVDWTVVITGQKTITCPLIKATNEGTRAKGQKLKHKTLIPTYCPWCGDKYIRGDK